MRIDKFLSDARVATRSEAAKAIRRAEVFLNGEAVRRADTQVDPETDAVLFYGEPVTYRKFIYVLLNKPDGYVSATEDKSEKTVLELLPEEVNRFGVFPCGRLDKNTLGLMLLTNNGDLAHRLLSPRHHVEKVYRFESAKPLSAEDIRILSAGVDIGGCVTAPCEVETDGGCAGTIILREGKYHQIKRMFFAVDNRILYLERVRFAFLTLEGLERGAWRYLTNEEITKLEKYK